MAGMVWIRGGRAEIGTRPGALADLLKGRRSWVQDCFSHESPRHLVTLSPYYIGKYEVTNAQYRRYLQDQEAVYVVKSGGPRTLDYIAACLVRRTKAHQRNGDQAVWLQLYRANKQVLREVFTPRERAVLELERGAREAWARDDWLRHRILPYGLELKFYGVRPPHNWPDMDPPRGEGDHPVRFVSYDDAERFAEWAGMHIPSEEEWEWAARGSNAPRFPWGDMWVADERYANWGGKIRDASGQPTTLAVDTHDGTPPRGSAGDRTRPSGDGRSWCGCHHMLGNVAEWTSSWFAPYSDRAQRNPFMGTWVKVIRGGGALDTERLALRPACRNFIGSGPGAPPYPENRFAWVGFRLAAYAQPARDRLGPIARRASGPNKSRSTPIELDLDRFAGVSTRSWAAPEDVPANHLYASGRSHAIVVVPLRHVLLRPRGQPRPGRLRKEDRRDLSPGSVRSARELVRNSWTRRPRLLLGVLHTDLPLANVEVRRPGPEKWRRSNAWAEMPEPVKGVCPPGTYLLSLWFGRLALLDPSMRFVCFVPGRTRGMPGFDIGRVLPSGLRPSALALDVPSDRADASFALPLGPLGKRKDLYLVVRMRLEFKTYALDVGEPWIVGD